MGLFLKEIDDFFYLLDFIVYRYEIVYYVIVFEFLFME